MKPKSIVDECEDLRHWNRVLLKEVDDLTRQNKKLWDSNAELAELVEELQERLEEAGVVE